MDLIFVYGPPAAGKYTISKIVADQTGYPLFHNHLIVDAVASVFPFGSPEFCKLREAFWMETFLTAARANRSLIFTFQPEPTVSPRFPQDVAQLVAKHGGRTIFIYLTLSRAEQQARVQNTDRSKFGKLRDRELLSVLHDQFDVCEAAMGVPNLTIDTALLAPAEAADLIRASLQGIDG
jgi:hypothetical protein